MRFLPTAELLHTELLRDGRAPEHPVAFGRRGPVCFRDLVGDVAALQPDLAKAGPGRWLVHTADPYAALVALLACAHTGSSALLAPNRLPGTLQALRSEVVGALLDAPAGDELAGLPVLNPLEQPPAPAAEWGALDREALFVDFLTSGTSGDAKRVPKRVRHLDDEVAELESLFGARADGLGEGVEVFATVSHQHVYGLLFRVLWPLAAGRPFSRDTFLQPSEIMAALSASPASLLIASPAHLSRMRPVEALARLRGRCRAVFSSGGPLDAASALAIFEALGAAPREILGSTETGGVAHRRRDPHEPGLDGEAWTPFPSVEVAPALGIGRLEVRSPFVSAGEDGPAGRSRFRMGDRIESGADGRFVLLGRADRVVKVGENRLSLPEMEARLLEHDAVAEVVLVPIERGGETRVHAVVVPSASGRDRVEGGGRRALGVLLADHLAAHYRRVLLPRAWRFVDALPRDAQGKTPVALLRALFDAEAEPVLDPWIEAERRGPGWIERDAVVPADLAYFDGHFAEAPIVPGVAQVRWVLAAGAALLGNAPQVKGFEALKFSRVLGPEAAFSLRVEATEGEDILRFWLRDAAGPVSSGRCRLARSGAAPTLQREGT